METQSLAILTELAVTARDAAAARRAQLQQHLQQAQQQLDVLRSYARDYAQRSQASLARGCDPAAQMNWRAFAAKLEQAVASQANEVAARERQLAAADAELNQAQRRLKSLQTLTERKQEAARLVEQRKEQKTTDELAAAGKGPLSATPW